MEKEYKTMTYGSGFPLKINTGKHKIFPKGIDVKAKVDMETGEVKFFIDKEDLNKLK